MLKSTHELQVLTDFQKVHRNAHVYCRGKHLLIFRGIASQYSPPRRFKSYLFFGRTQFKIHATSNAEVLYDEAKWVATRGAAESHFNLVLLLTQPMRRVFPVRIIKCGIVVCIKAILFGMLDCDI